MTEHDTAHSVPLPRRPITGLQAWLATIGYISAEYSADATLTMRASPSAEGRAVWSAETSWGHNRESLQDMPSLPGALRELWKLVERNHVIFKSLEAATRRPANYSDAEWMDADTRTTLDRLVTVTNAACGDNWRLIIVYQALDNPDLRVQARLMAKGKQIGGRASSIREACRDLYRNAAPVFANAGQPFDPFFAEAKEN
jgi:hypothetical protein